MKVEEKIQITIDALNSIDLYPKIENGKKIIKIVDDVLYDRDIPWNSDLKIATLGYRDRFKSLILEDSGEFYFEKMHREFLSEITMRLRITLKAS